MTGGSAVRSGAAIGSSSTRARVVSISRSRNQTLDGPLSGGSRVRRAMLAEALASIGYAAWNADDDHAIRTMRPIDLICGPRDTPILARGRIDPKRGSITMSDHAGYWVDLNAEG